MKYFVVIGLAAMTALAVVLPGLTQVNTSDPITQTISYGVTGSCDNRAAIAANNSLIQLALDSGKDVYFPPGNYPHSSLGFRINSPRQHIYGAACTGMGSAAVEAPFCPSSIQDCSGPLDWPIGCADGQNCGYLSVFSPQVEIHDLMIRGNTPRGSMAGAQNHKGIYGTHQADGLYVHDVFVSETNGESIYSDAAGTDTRFFNNTVTDSSLVGLNTNNFAMKNVQIADNMVINVGGCILVAANDAYVLRNICRGGPVATGGDAINLTAPEFHVIAFNTIDQWNSACCAVGILHLGFPGPTNITGSGVIAYNIISGSLMASNPDRGAALEIESVDGPEIIAFNMIVNNANGPAALVHGKTGPLLFSNNAMDGHTTGIRIYSDVPAPNHIRIETNNTYGAIPTPNMFMVTPSGAPSELFRSTAQRAKASLVGSINFSR